MKLLFKEYPAHAFVDQWQRDAVWHGPVNSLERPNGFGVYFSKKAQIQAIIFGDFNSGVTVKAKGVMFIYQMTYSIEGLFVGGDLYQGTMAMYHS